MSIKSWDSVSLCTYWSYIPMNTWVWLPSNLNSTESKSTIFKASLSSKVFFKLITVWSFSNTTFYLGNENLRFLFYSSQRKSIVMITSLLVGVVWTVGVNVMEEVEQVVDTWTEEEHEGEVILSYRFRVNNYLKVRKKRKENKVREAYQGDTNDCKNSLTKEDR